MSNPLERRIARLEALRPPKSDKIPVFVRREDDVPKKIEEMIATGEIAEADRHRCAWWLDIKRRVLWQQQWEDEKLLAEDAAREKARQEQAEREKPERDKPEQKTAEPAAAEQRRSEQDTAGPPTEQPEPPQSEPEPTEPQQAEPSQPKLPQPEPQAPEQPAADDGRVPPGCL
jgi:hypothetical protein